MNHARPGWPHRAPGGIAIWLDRMRAYVDAHVGVLPHRGEPVPLTLLAPATSVGPITVTRNPDGSATLDGHLDIPGPVDAGEALAFARMPVGYGLADSAGLMARAHVSGVAGPIVVGIDINGGDGGDLFVVASGVGPGDLLMVVLDGVTFWPARSA